MKTPQGSGRSRGFTLIELMGTVAIVAILAVLALPSFSGLIDKYRLKGAAEALNSEIQFARTEAIRRNQPVYVAFGTTTGSCYGIGTDAECTCDSCEIRKRTAAQFAADFRDIEIASVQDPGGALTRFGFSPRQGTIDAVGSVSATLRSKQSSRQLTVIISLLGIPRMCSPGGTIPGYATC